MPTVILPVNTQMNVGHPAENISVHGAFFEQCVLRIDLELAKFSMEIKTLSQGSQLLSPRESCVHVKCGYVTTLVNMFVH